MTAIVTVVVIEAVGLGLYVGLLKPNFLHTLLSDPGDMETKMLIAANGDVFLVAAVLIVLGLAVAFRSSPTDTNGGEPSAASREAAPEDDTSGGFAFDSE